MMDCAKPRVCLAPFAEPSRSPAVSCDVPGAGPDVPEGPSLTQRPPADAAAPALEIVEHRGGLVSHLLAQTFGHYRDVDEGEELVCVRSQAAAVERCQDAGFAAVSSVVNR